MILSTEEVEVVQGIFGDLVTAASLKLERFGDNADGKNAFCLARRATTGAAPEPVPPPMPAVMKTMLAPSSSFSISSAASSAAKRPTSGQAPANPVRAWFRLRVGFYVPIWSWQGPGASVLATIKSTPSKFLDDHIVDGVTAAAAYSDN